MNTDTRSGPDLSGAGRYYAIVLTALGALTLFLQMLSLGPLRASFWGFHLYAFLPFVVAVIGWLTLCIAGVDLWRPLVPAPRIDRVGPALDRRPLVTALVLAALAAAVFWIFRSGQILLGDGHPLVTDLPGGQSFHPRQPGTMWLQQMLYQQLGGLFRAEGVTESDVAWRTVALGSVAAGFLFVMTAFFLGRTLTRSDERSRANETGTERSTPWLVTAILLTQGYALLFFGYVENYTFYTLFVALYLWTALLSFQRRMTMQLVAVVFAGGLLLHLSMIALLPSLLFLIAMGMRRKETRNDAVVTLVYLVGGLFVVNLALHAMSPGYDLAKALRDLFDIARTPQAGGAGVAYTFSPVHLRDFFNEQFLIGPLAAFLFVPAFAWTVAKRNPWDGPAVFFSIAALCFLAGSFMMSEPLLGYARDWDLFAPAAVCYTASGVYFLLRHVRGGDARRRLLGFALVFSLLQLVAWIGINHSERLALERFKTLPLGYGRTEVVVANWYYRHDRFDESAEWLQKALEANPRNANAHNLLANVYIAWGDTTTALSALRNATLLRPDKVEFHDRYAFLLLKQGMYEQAIPELVWLTDREPRKVVYWRGLHDALIALERPEELRIVNERLLGLYDSLLLDRPNDVYLMTEMGAVLGELGDYQQAMDRFHEALRLDPDNDAALFDAGSLLARLGQADAARPYLTRFLELYPESPMAPAARELLSTGAGPPKN